MSCARGSSATARSRASLSGSSADAAIEATTCCTAAALAGASGEPTRTSNRQPPLLPPPLPLLLPPKPPGDADADVASAGDEAECACGDVPV
jgi:hypothetical protein